MKNDVKTRKILVGLTGFILAVLLLKTMNDSDNDTETSFGTRFRNWWNNLIGVKTNEQPLVVASSTGAVSTSTVKNVVRLTTTGLFTIPSGVNWLNIVNKGDTNNATAAFGTGAPSKLYVDQPTYIEKKNDSDILPSVVINGNGEEVLVEYSINA